MNVLIVPTGLQPGIDGTIRVGVDIGTSTGVVLQGSLLVDFSLSEAQNRAAMWAAVQSLLASAGVDIPAGTRVVLL